MATRYRAQYGVHCLEIDDCPIAVLEGVARAAGVGATVENLHPQRSLDWLSLPLALHPGAPVREHRIRDACFDVALDNAAFLELLPFWDRHGVYAVFAERGPIAFRASALPEAARYRALANFGFVLEFGLAGPTAGPASRLASPRRELIDLAMALAEAAAAPG